MKNDVLLRMGEEELRQEDLRERCLEGAEDVPSLQKCVPDVASERLGSSCMK